MTSKTLEEEFCILLGRMAYCYSHLEFAVGLCLRFMLSPQNPILANPRIADRPTAKRLGQLKQAVKSKVGQKDPEFMNSFNSWINAMDKFRVKRNNYMHGLWRVCELPDIEGPIEFEPVHWKQGANGKRSTYGETQYMELSELSAVVEEIEALQERFSSLQDKLYEVLREIARELRNR